MALATQHRQGLNIQDDGILLGWMCHYANINHELPGFRAWLSHCTVKPGPEFITQHFALPIDKAPWICHEAYPKAFSPL